ncbi:hypothetical protein BH23ACT11_BH23ACT11_30130 [soil metagenome]
MEATVSQIHNYPLRPAGYEEPLFAGRMKKREVMEYFLQSDWITRASEIVSDMGYAARLRRDPVDLKRSADGSTVLIRVCGRRRSVRSVRRVLARWRQVRHWWKSDGGEDLVIYRLLLSDGAVVDVARDFGSGVWTLVGIVD